MRDLGVPLQKPGGPDITPPVRLPSVPLGRLIEAEDVAKAALYLASDLAEMVTGHVLEVDGGRAI